MRSNYGRYLYNWPTEFAPRVHWRTLPRAVSILLAWALALACAISAALAGNGM